jgi:type II secretion system protein I
MRTRKSAAGFTLIEVLLAVVMLAILTLALMSNSAKMIRGVTDDRTRTLAATSADERIARIRVWPTYTTLEATFVAVESNTPLTGWTRTTTMTRTGTSGGVNDYKRATVVVTGPGLPVPISRSVALAAP